MSEARRAGSSEAPKSAGRDVGSIDCPSDGVAEKKQLEKEDEVKVKGAHVRLVEPSAWRCPRKVCCTMRA